MSQQECLEKEMGILIYPALQLPERQEMPQIPQVYSRKEVSSRIVYMNPA